MIVQVILQVQSRCRGREEEVQRFSCRGSAEVQSRCRTGAEEEEVVATEQGAEHEKRYKCRGGAVAEC